MKWIGVSLIYGFFFSLIGVAIWVTGSAWPLLALVLMPGFRE